MEGELAVWECETCTFHNQEAHLSCSMCAQVRPVGTQSFSNDFYIHSPSDSFELNADDSSANGLEIVESRSRSGEPSYRGPVSRLLGSAMSGALTGMFALVGAFAGAVTGALALRTTEGGFVRGAGLGAVAGAVLSVELLEASRSLWIANSRSSSASSSSMGEIFDEIVSGVTISEQVNIDDMTYDELYEMFGAGDASMKGASEAFLQALPSHIIKENPQGAARDHACCPICLQDLLHGEVARSLPHCKHTFHKACVDEWLIQQRSCPVCRHVI